ncbi:MBL fold metallo-hydrolase [Arthrobacter roseus]|uniref:MBL fold metallo-hydrolase n=1 Tax=Arthrobacter roseus TaxID=136274 RepID=UPI0019625ABE|nr:MBL fold metallo-hydrolase [Arthrobacter roseus]MBM7849042.1 L-ascorbate metabolism protein UlaG (beta-lactamase superfamily) [Arthrobacter roseus]
MLMTKHGHSCVRLEKDGIVLVLDPGTLSRVPEALEGANAILVTHEHPDHIDQETVLAFMASNPALELYAPGGVAARLADAAPGIESRIHHLDAGQSAELVGFQVRAVGGQHALIHPRIPVVANLGYVIDETLYHPGDSFIVPENAAIQTLLVPLHAPWSKTAEVIDFVIAVGPERAYPIHDALLNDAGRALVENLLRSISAAHGTTFESLTAGENVNV